MRMHLAGWACVLAAGVVLAGDKPKKDKPTTPPDPTQFGSVAGALIGAPTGQPKNEAVSNQKFTVTKPVGTWVRETDVSNATCRLVLTVTDDRLTLKVDLKNGHQTSTLRLDADYAINKESCLFGVIDSCDATSSHTSDTSELAKLSGQPFSVRFRAEGDGLTLKEFKGFGVGAVETASKEMAPVLAVLCGRYTKADPAKPLPELKESKKETTGSDPLIRQDQLLNQSESFGQPGSTNHTPPRPADPPSHLTPQRIHGGILKADPPKDGTRLGGVPYPTPHYLKHYPTYIPPDPPLPLKVERDSMLDPTTGEIKRTKAEEPAAEPTRVLPPLAAGECGECDPPTDAAVLKAVGAKAKEFDGTITIIKNNVKDQLDPARYYPLVGFARTHHCQWECRVYFSRDLRTEKPEVEVVYLDTDYLRLASAGQIVVPQRMPER